MYNKEGLAFALTSQASVEWGLKDGTSAVEHLDESIPIFREIDADWELAWALRVRGTIVRADGRDDRARALYSESLSIWDALDAKWGLATVLERIAHGWYEDHPSLCVRLLGAVSVLRDRIGAPRPPRTSTECKKMVSALQFELSEHAYETDWKKGAAMDRDDAIALGRAIMRE